VDRLGSIIPGSETLRDTVEIATDLYFAEQGRRRINRVTNTIVNVTPAFYPDYYARTMLGDLYHRECLPVSDWLHSLHCLLEVKQMMQG
jgi:hypothetical protein